MLNSRIPPASDFDEDKRNPLRQNAEIVVAITNILKQTCQRNRELMQQTSSYRSNKYPDGSSSIFFCIEVPDINLRKYISRLVNTLRVSRSVFIVTLIYLDRLRVEDDVLFLSDLNVHRLVTACLTVAMKYMEDVCYRNSSISKVSGVRCTAEMNVLELQVLRRLKWKCWVDKDTYEMYQRVVFRYI